MARLQILELPEAAGDDRPPFVLVVDECAPQRIVIGMDSNPIGDYWQGVADRIGARGVIVTAETVEIPANAEPIEVDDAERAGTTQIVYAHERTRLDLCAALLVSGDTTWSKLVETVTKRQQEVADLYRQLDELKANPEQHASPNRDQVREIVRDEIRRATGAFRREGMRLR
jgi:hypothetical protein